ncbi:MAG: alpha/beta fold hydrolase [Candidatus Rokubacteria bacterium]|nr:alpha/beta fold hydrolase [Candidatus Rokubacteria bacterium]
MPEITLRGGELDGLRLYYLAEGSGLPVVLVHGLGGFAESWRHNLGALGHKASVYALDLPGFGQSSKPLGGYALGFFVEVLEQFRAALGLARLTLVGHSLGGAVAAAYAVSHPAKVDRLSFIAAVIPGFDYRPSWVYGLLAARGVGEVMARLLWPGLLRAALARCFAEPVPAEVDFLVQRGHAARATAAGQAAFLSALREARDDFRRDAERYRRALSALDLPVLAIHGCQDRVVPLAHAETVARSLPRAALRVLDRCGHFPQIEHASTVNEWLGEFIASVPIAADG